MQLHAPDIYDGHRNRGLETLTYIAELMGLTVAQAEERNWIVSEIRTDRAPPAAATTTRKRGRPAGSKAASTQAAQLSAALDFVAVAVNDALPFGEFVSLTNNMAIVYSGQLSAGHPIVEELSLVPHLAKLKAALNKCGKSLVITETEGRALSIKGDKLRAVVPCHADIIPTNEPDPPVLEGDFNALKEAFKVCGTLVSESAERVVTASLLLEPNTCTGTNGVAMLQYWHGISLPPGTVVSKLFAAAIAKQSKKITGLGATIGEGGFATSFTVWFEGGAWIKTQCYNDRWPTTIDAMLTGTGEKIDTPVGLFEAIEAVLPFVESKERKPIYFMQDYVQSHSDASVGAQYPVAGLPGGRTYDGKLMSQVAPWVKRIDFTTLDDRAHFVGGEATNPVRGVIMGMGQE